MTLDQKFVHWYEVRAYLIFKENNLEYKLIMFAVRYESLSTTKVKSTVKLSYNVDN